MTISRLRPHLAAALTALITCAALLSLSTAPAWAAAVAISEFPLPQHGVPNGITSGRMATSGSPRSV
jgi:hypothetical protein